MAAPIAASSCALQGRATCEQQPHESLPDDARYRKGFIGSSERWPKGSEPEVHAPPELPRAPIAMSCHCGATRVESASQVGLTRDDTLMLADSAAASAAQRQPGRPASAAHAPAGQGQNRRGSRYRGHLLLSACGVTTSITSNMRHQRMHLVAWSPELMLPPNEAAVADGLDLHKHLWMCCSPFQGFQSLICATAVGAICDLLLPLQQLSAAAGCRLLPQRCLQRRRGESD